MYWWLSVSLCKFPSAQASREPDGASVSSESQRPRIACGWQSAVSFLLSFSFSFPFPMPHISRSPGTLSLTWMSCSKFNAVCFIFLTHFPIWKCMMTFSRFHKVFINVITNIFHRSFKLILLSGVIPSRSTRICQIEKERDVEDCLGLCVYLGVCTHTHTHMQQGVDCLRVSKVSLHEPSQKTSIPPLLPVKTVIYHSISSLSSLSSFYIPPFFFHPRICW